MEYFNEDERATTGPNNMDKSNIMWTEISHLPKNCEGTRSSHIKHKMETMIPSL